MGHISHLRTHFPATICPWTWGNVQFSMWRKCWWVGEFGRLFKTRGPSMPAATLFRHTLGLFTSFIREIQSWPQSQSQSQSHVTSKLRHVYYPMSKVWSEHEYSVQKLSSSVDFQIMLISCVQKKVLSTEGIYHWNRANEEARWSPTKRVCMGAWTDTLGKKRGTSTIRLWDQQYHYQQCKYDQM